MGVSRRKQREIVAKSLYTYEVHRGNIDIESLVEYPLLTHHPDEIDYAMKLLKKTIASEKEIFVLLESTMQNNKTLKDVQQIDIAILRMAISEMLYFSVEPKVAINEAIEISKKYSTDVSFKLINGILETVKNSLTKKI